MSGRRWRSNHLPALNTTTKTTSVAKTKEASFTLTMSDALALADRIRQLKDSLPGLKAESVGVQRMPGDGSERVGLLAARDIRDREVGPTSVKHVDIITAQNYIQ